MHLADRLHHLEQDLNQLKERVDRKSEEFAGMLEQALEGEWRGDDANSGVALRCAFVCGVLWAASDAYRAQIEEWRRHREAALTADGGWLTVTGLFWLHEGANSFGSGIVQRYRAARRPRR